MQKVQKGNKKLLKPIPDKRVLKKRLWKVFSLYTRLRYADWQGMEACVTCGVVKHYKYMHAGHYVPQGSSLATTFDERNVHPQCYHCNVPQRGNLSNYAVFLTRKYGSDILELLDWKRHQRCDLDQNDYINLIKEYKNKIKKLWWNLFAINNRYRYFGLK